MSSLKLFPCEIFHSVVFLKNDKEILKTSSEIQREYESIIHLKAVFAELS